MENVRVSLDPDLLSVPTKLIALMIALNPLTSAVNRQNCDLYTSAMDVYCQLGGAIEFIPLLLGLFTQFSLLRQDSDWCALVHHG